jgi:predicted ATPase/class 3 adenylate cyclase
MGELPSGTVSLLFSDIEGSTVLLQRLGSAYADALDGHRRILRQAWSDFGGTELGTEGDSFFVVFRDATAAVAAAAAVQRQLEAASWPAGERVRVRIGLHTGTPRVHDGGYVGMDVHRAARIASAAHGGQVVLSDVTAELARHRLPDGVTLRDLGLHHLKDIAAPEHLWQLDIAGVQSEFRPLRTIGATSRLPVTATRLVGRDEELRSLISLLQRPDVRLVTLTGPGGSGKTRLAVGVAERLMVDFPDGVYFVPLVAATKADTMWTSMAEAVGVPRRRRTPEGLVEYLSDRHVLLVLDNLEQLPDADEVVDRLLTSVRTLSVVATSRRPLFLAAEYRYPVPPLALPEGSTLATAASSSAVQLLVALAQRTAPGFRLSDANAADLAAICRRLDGLPLAIELVATRLRLLSPHALRRRIDSAVDTALDIASTGRQTEHRQKTLRDTITWSYELLTPEEQGAFRRLGVFAGGADLAAIAAVLAEGTRTDRLDNPLETVAELVDVSLVVAADGPNGEPRFTMLETIRAYARDELQAAGEAPALHGRHARHYLAVAQQLQDQRESQHLAALDRATAEQDNLREALAWSLEGAVETSPDERTEVGLLLCAALSWFWYAGGYAGEGLRWYERVVDQAGDQPSIELTVCLSGMANLLLSRGQLERALGLAERSVRMARSLDDHESTAFALSVLGTAQQQSGQSDRAQRSLEEAVQLYRERGPSGRMARALGNLAGSTEMSGDYARAEGLIRESLATFEDLGDSHEATIQAQNLANLLVTSGRAQEAQRLAESLVDTVLALRNPNLTMAFGNTFMNILVQLGRPVPAAHLFGAEQAMRRRLELPNPYEDEELEEARAAVERFMSVDEWDHERRRGQHESLEELLVRLHAS